MNSFYQKGVIVALCAFCLTKSLDGKAQIKIWGEDLGDESVNATTGNDDNLPSGADWTSTNSGSVDYFQVRNVGTDHQFYAKEVDGESVWTSEVIDVSGKDWYISMEYTANGNDLFDGDSFEIYFNIDGGGEQLEYQHSWVTGDVTDLALTSSLFENVSTVQIIIKIDNDDNDDIFSFDDINIYQVEDIYSISSGDWSDGNTWSAVSHSGPSCGCVPNDGRNAIIGNGDDITVDADGEAVGIQVDNGSLTFGGNFSLSLQRGGNVAVASGSSINANGNTGGTLTINSSSTTDLNVDGGLSVGDLAIPYGTTLNLTGSGNVNILNDVLLNADNININNSLDLTVEGDFIYNTYTFLFWTLTYTDAVIVNNGSFTFSGDFNGNSGDFGNGDFYFTNNSSFIHTGNYTNLDGGSFTNATGATWDWSGSAADANLSGLIDLTASNNLFTYSRSGAQPVLATTYDHVTFSGSGTKTSQGNIVVNGDMTISGTSQLDVDTGDDNITIAGDWINTSGNSNPFVEGGQTETVTFNGPGAQNIGGTESFNLLTVNKTGTLTLGGDIQVASTLTLTSGYVGLNGNDLTVQSTGSISGGSSSSFVVTDATGSLYQNNLGAGGRTGTITFPVGAGTSSYTPVSINNAGTTDDFGIWIGSNLYDEGYSGNAQTSEVVGRTWYVSEGAAGGSDVTLSFQWDGTEELTGFDRTNLNVIHYNGTDWEVLANASASGSGPYTVSASGINSFSPFGVEGVTGPLPVELLNFDAVLQDGSVQLSWKTASELNNDFFTVEKTDDLEEYVEVVKVKGNGTTGTQHEYTAKDVSPYSGVSYYRLKQTDFDGTATYSDPVRVDNSSMAGREFFDVYPVPNSGRKVNFRVAGDADSGKASIQVLDLHGKVLYESSTVISNAQEVTINFNDKLKPGIYNLVVKTDKVLTKQFFVQ